MHEVQPEEQVRRAYDARADEYAAAFRSTEPEQALELAMVDHFAAMLRGRRTVLDAGCGAGRFLPILSALGCDVQGVDLSPEMVRNARACHPAFPVRVGSLTGLPFASGTFDGYFSWYSTIHSADADLRVALREAHRVLRPGGSLLVAFQSGAGVEDLSASFGGGRRPLLRYLRSPERMADELVSAGFTLAARCDRRPVGDHESGDQAVLVAAR